MEKAAAFSVQHRGQKGDGRTRFVLEHSNLRTLLSLGPFKSKKTANPTSISAPIVQRLG
jgi:hypothetical protein